MSYLDVFQQIKSVESIFTPPANYATVDVGTALGKIASGIGAISAS